MFLCDTNLKDDVKADLEYSDVEQYLHAMRLLKNIKRLVYAKGGTVAILNEKGVTNNQIEE